MSSAPKNGQFSLLSLKRTRGPRPTLPSAWRPVFHSVWCDSLVHRPLVCRPTVALCMRVYLSPGYANRLHKRPLLHRGCEARVGVRIRWEHGFHTAVGSSASFPSTTDPSVWQNYASTGPIRASTAAPNPPASETGPSIDPSMPHRRRQCRPREPLISTATTVGVSRAAGQVQEELKSNAGHHPGAWRFFQVLPRLGASSR